MWLRPAGLHLLGVFKTEASASYAPKGHTHAKQVTLLIKTRFMIVTISYISHKCKELNILLIIGNFCTKYLLLTKLQL